MAKSHKKLYQALMIALVFALTLLSGTFAENAQAAQKKKRGYTKVGNAYYYFLKDGSRARNCWKTVDGVKHWFTSTGREVKATKTIAFSFDDGPTANTAKVLKILNSYGCTATFFQVGYMVQALSDKSVEKEIWASGSEIGNHSWNHPFLGRMGGTEILSQLNRASDQILKASGKRPALIRPPYGSVSSTLRAVAPQPLITWSIDDQTIYTHNGMTTAYSIMRNPRDGDICLMHDLHPWCITTIEYTIPRLIQQGFRIVSVSDLAEIQGKKLQRGVIYSSIRK